MSETPFPDPPDDFDYAECIEDDDVCPYCKADYSEECGDELNGYACRLNDAALTDGAHK